VDRRFFVGLHGEFRGDQNVAKTLKAEPKKKYKRRTSLPWTERLKWTPPIYAHFLGVDPAKVVGWVKSGELPAIDISDGRGKPRFLIDRKDIAEFEQRRLFQAAPKSAPRRRPSAQSGVKEYF
jgi:Helix-turn-helix domain